MAQVATGRFGQVGYEIGRKVRQPAWRMSKEIVRDASGLSVTPQSAQGERAPDENRAADQGSLP